MARVMPYHTSSKEYPPSHREVYHDHNDCKYGGEIKRKDKQSGTGGKPRCEECRRLG